MKKQVKTRTKSEEKSLENGFTIVPNDLRRLLYNKTINLCEYAIMMVIQEWSGKEGKKLSINYIAKSIGSSDSTVSRHKTSLIKKGLIQTSTENGISHKIKIRWTTVLELVKSKESDTDKEKPLNTVLSEKTKKATPASHSDKNELKNQSEKPQRTYHRPSEYSEDIRPATFKTQRRA